MSRYTGPKCKLARREKLDLELKRGLTSLAKKCDMSKSPGEHGSSFARVSNYGKQLRTKQKLKSMYGLREKQFKSYYSIAKKVKGSSSLNLIHCLELRLDNLVYRMGFAYTRAHARQIVSHKGVHVNNKLCNIPSFRLQIGDEVKLKDKTANQAYVLDAMKNARSNLIFPWLFVDHDSMSGKVVDLPDRSYLTRDINEQLVIELYSGKK